jgi:hypothetical protein
VAAEAIVEQIDQKSGHWALEAPHEVSDDSIDLARRLLGLPTPVKNEADIEKTFIGPPERLDAVIYGDGYLKNLIPYLSQIMGRIETVETNVIPSRRYGENWLATETILLETAESRLGTMRLDVDKIYTILATDTLLPSSYPIDPESFVPEANVSLRNRAEGLEIKSVGDASRFAIMSIPGSDDQIFRLLKLTVEALHSDTMTFKFESDLPLITHRALRPGFATLCLPLPFQKELSLSVRPGSKAGVLTLKSAEILAFAALRATTEPRQLKNLLAKWPSDKNITLAKLDLEPAAITTNPAPKLSESKLNSGNSDDASQPKAPVSDLKAAFEKVFANQGTRLKKGAIRTPFTKSVTTPSKSKVEKSKNDVDRKIPPDENDSGIAIAKASIVEPKRKIDHSKDEDMNENDQSYISRTGPTSRPALPAISLNDIADGRIFQRRRNSADIVISGTYSGALQAVEARVVQSDTQAQIVPWTLIDSAPANGIFVGRLDNVPQGGWYFLQVRSQSNHSIMADGKHRWGIGMLIACLGQSNMNEWFHTGNDLKAHSLLRKFNDRGWSRLNTTGNAAIAFGNRIIERLGIPVGLLDYAVNGSGLRKEADWGTGHWTDAAPGSIYNRFISGVSAVGGVLEFVIWIQGEADAARGTVTQEEYARSLTQFVEDQVRIDISNGSQREQLPFLVVMMIKRPGGKDKPHQAIRNAQKQVVENLSDCYLAATTLDLRNHGRQHLTPKAYISMGQRVAQSVLYIAGKESYHRGPQVVDSRRIDDYTVEVKIQHHGGNDFVPSSSISGWEIIADGRPVKIQKVYRHDASTIRIVTIHPFTGSASIRYLYGAMPDVKHAVLDNSRLSLPLEEYQSEIR